MEIFPHKYSKLYFFSYYFMNMLEVCSDLPEMFTKEEKAKEILMLVNMYRKRYGTHKNRGCVEVWVRMKKYYWDNWDEIHYWGIIIEKKLSIS